MAVSNYIYWIYQAIRSNRSRTHPRLRRVKSSPRSISTARLQRSIFRGSCPVLSAMMTSVITVRSTWRPLRLVRSLVLHQFLTLPRKGTSLNAQRLHRVVLLRFEAARWLSKPRQRASPEVIRHSQLRERQSQLMANGPECFMQLPTKLFSWYRVDY